MSAGINQNTQGHDSKTNGNMLAWKYRLYRHKPLNNMIIFPKILTKDTLQLTCEGKVRSVFYDFIV